MARGVSMTRHSLFLFVLLISLITHLNTANAKLFRNGFISFELPEEEWDCHVDNTEWVCRSTDQKQIKETAIVISAKEVGTQDTLEEYEKLLSSPKFSMVEEYKDKPSKVIYPAKRVRINDHQWIDGLHFGSELGSYYTRYIATTKDGVAILVTLSAAKAYYTKHSKNFFKSVQSLRIIGGKNLLNNKDLGPLRSSQEILGANVGASLPSEMMDLSQGQETGVADSMGKGSTTKQIILIIAIILAALGGYLFIKGRNR